MVPFLLAGEFGLSSVGVGAVVTAAMATSFAVSLLSGRLVRRVPNVTLLGVGHACYAVGMAGVWLAGSPLAVAGAVVVHGAGVGLSLPAVDAAISERTAPETRAGALGLRVSTSFAGRTLGPVAFAALGGMDALLGGVGIAVLGLVAVVGGR
ncbi:MAG: MFS transporter [Halobacteriaceae archaeon]